MDSAPRSRRAAAYGTAIALAHLAVNLVHGTAHEKLRIDLTAAQMVFVAAVILAGPLIAMLLLWTRWQRAGLILLAVTMAGSLAFGLYHHFVAAGPDHVGEQAPGFWGNTFGITAYLLFLTEAAGAYAGVRFLYRRADPE